MININHASRRDPRFFAAAAALLIVAAKPHQPAAAKNIDHTTIF